MKPFMLKKLARETSRFVLQSLANRQFILIFVCVLAGLPAENQAVPSGPPASSPRPRKEETNGTKITDNHRWLENGNSPETQKWIAVQIAYTRSELDPLPRRDLIHKRLTELLAIGDIGVPTIPGKYDFYTRREGLQNQPVLYVREGINGKDRVLIDVNSLAPEGT